MNFTFDEVKHEYLKDGIRFPSVTQIIKPLSDIDKIPSSILKPRAIRGTRIHKMCQDYLEGTLIFESLNDEFKRILDYFILFLNKEGKDFDIESAYLEYPMVHKRLKYAGKGDIICDGHAVIDIKSSKFGSITLPLQLVAYEKLWIADCGLKEKYEHYRLVLDKDQYSFDKVNKTKTEYNESWSRFRFMLEKVWSDIEFNKKN